MRNGIAPRRLGLRSVGGLVALGLALAACAPAAAPTTPGLSGTPTAGAASPAASAPAGLGKVVIGVGTDPSLAPWIVAVEKGFFEKHGLEAELVPYANGPASVEALLSGQTDIGGAGELSSIGPAARGGDLAVVGTMWTSGVQTGITAVADIQEPQDLEGRVVAIQEGGVSQYYFERYVEVHGLDRESIEVKAIAQPDMVSAFARGDMDAYFITEPALTLGVEAREGAHILARSEDDDVYVLHAYMIFAPDLYNDVPRAEAAVRALLDAVEFINTNKDEAVTITADWTQLEEEQTRTIMDRIDFNFQWTEDDAAHIQSIGSWMVENELIESEPQWDKFVQVQFLKTVAPDKAPGEDL